MQCMVMMNRRLRAGIKRLIQGRNGPRLLLRNKTKSDFDMEKEEGYETVLKVYKNWYQFENISGGMIS